MSNRTYDLIVLLDADAPSDTRTKIVNDTQSLINQHGDVKASKDWGTRQTPYPIDHHEEAAFHVFQFETDPEAIQGLDRGLKLTEGVLRFRIIKSEPGAELPSAPPAFKREERAYERPPANVAATPELDETPSAPAEPSTAEAPAEEADAPAEAAPAEVAAEPAAEAAETPAETPAEAPAPEPAAAAAPEAAEAPAEEAAPAEAPDEEAPAE